MLVLAGLGNPGTKYEATRHNIGFMVVDEIADAHGFSPWRARFQGMTAEGLIAGRKVLLLKPMTYMNESGRAVGETLRFFKLDLGALTVFYDDLDLAPGKIRIKTGGGAGGHNGIRSIDAHMGKDYHRVRLGIGHPGDKAKVLGYVLSQFAKPELTGWLPALIDSCAREAPALVEGDTAKYMSRVSQAVFPPPPKPAKPAPETQTTETKTPPSDPSSTEGA
jgi:peptidyl-tRNA hydrolase, PTH1 family